MKPALGVWKLSRRKSPPHGRKPCSTFGGTERNVPGPTRCHSPSWRELDLALEHVERIGVVGVGVRVDALEVGPERELERLDVRQLGEDAMPVLPDPLALAGPDEVRLVHRRGS